MRTEFTLIVLAAALFAWVGVRHLPPWATVAGAVAFILIWKRVVLVRIQERLDAESDAARAPDPSASDVPRDPPPGEDA